MNADKLVTLPPIGLVMIVGEDQLNMFMEVAVEFVVVVEVAVVAEVEEMAVTTR